LAAGLVKVDDELSLMAAQVKNTKDICRENMLPAGRDSTISATHA